MNKNGFKYIEITSGLELQYRDDIKKINNCILITVNDIFTGEYMNKISSNRVTLNGKDCFNQYLIIDKMDLKNNVITARLIESGYADGEYYKEIEKVKLIF